MEKIRVMFLCTGNACRSQMAEGWARQLASDWIEVRSAGIEAHGQNTLAVRVMSEVSIDIANQQSIRVNAEMLEWADVLVTLCDNAQEQCPLPPAHTLRIHLPLTDPAKLRGDQAALLAEFRDCRDRVRQRVEHVLQQLATRLASGAV